MKTFFNNIFQLKDKTKGIVKTKFEEFSHLMSPYDTIISKYQ